MMHLVAAATAADGSDLYVQGGVAVAVLGFAGGIVKAVLGLLSIEQKRSDRLESAALAAVPAMAAANTAQQQQTTTIAELSRRVEDLLRERRS